MTALIEMDLSRIKALYLEGLRHVDIAADIGKNKDTVATRIRSLVRSGQLPPRQKAKSMQPRKFVAVPVPVHHVAAVRMPSDPLRDRADWGDIEAAIHRAKSSPGPLASLGMVAARFRLPVSLVMGEAAR